LFSRLVAVILCFFIEHVLDDDDHRCT